MKDSAQRGLQWLGMAALFVWLAAVYALIGGVGFGAGAVSAFVLDWLGLFPRADGERTAEMVVLAGAALGALCGVALAWRVLRAGEHRLPDDDSRQ